MTQWCIQLKMFLTNIYNYERIIKFQHSGSAADITQNSARAILISADLLHLANNTCSFVEGI